MNRRRWARSGVTAVIAVAVGGGGYAAYAAATEGPTGYRTAPVTTGDVKETLALSGTVSPVGRSDLAFGADGTVAWIAALGSHVRKGQVVARLDLTSLRRDVTRAQAAVDAARLQRERDEDSQADQVADAADAAASSSSTPSSTASPQQQATVQPTRTSQPTAQHSAEPTTAPSPSGSSSQVRHLLEQLAAQQQAVERAQSSVSKAVADAQQAMDAQAKACSTATSTPAPSPSESASPSTEPTDDPTADCQSAVTAVETAQEAVADAEYAGDGNLRDALAALAQTLAAYAGQVSSGGTESGGKQPTQQPTEQPTEQPTAQPSEQPTRKPTHQSTKQPTKQPTTSPSTAAAETPTRQSGDTVTAATLAQDQATIDQAKADLVTAQQALHGATLRAPAAGTVAAVDVAKGDAAAAGSDVVTIVSKGLTTVAVDVSDTQVRRLKVGQRATVTPAGSATRLAGRVSRIGEVPDTSSGSTTYPVTVTLDKRGLGLLTGTSAAVDVVVASADAVLTVPTSAVADDAVTVLVRGEPQRVHVTTGLVGRSRTQVTDGLTAGEQVVLADLSTPLPTGDDSGSRGGFGRSPDVRGFGGPVTFTR